MVPRRCSFCGGTHTETKCPSLEGWVQHAINVVAKSNSSISEYYDFSKSPEEIMEDNSPDWLWTVFRSSATQQDYLGKTPHRWWQYFRSYKKRLNYKRAGEKRRGKKRTRALRCGYCGDTGHTRRTCSELEAAKKILVADTTLRRAMFVDVCRKLGLGKGALIKFTLTEEGRGYKEKGYSSFQTESFIAMVVDLPVASINCFSKERTYSDFYQRSSIVCKPLTGDKTGDNVDIALTINNNLFNGAFNKVIDDMSHQHYNSFYDIEIVSRSDNMSWNKADGDNYLNFLKKKNKADFGNIIWSSEQWLQKNK